mmetsp:Transcript_20011/g.50646  ORF Transcript_20011/g.50646 Transcript_20011/m.50646 type:complete len:200 (-) Transcript_20011:921-1520(-)
MSDQIVFCVQWVGPMLQVRGATFPVNKHRVHHVIRIDLRERLAHRATRLGDCLREGGHRRADVVSGLHADHLLHKAKEVTADLSRRQVPVESLDPATHLGILGQVGLEVHLRKGTPDRLEVLGRALRVRGDVHGSVWVEAVPFGGANEGVGVDAAALLLELLGVVAHPNMKCIEPGAENFLGDLACELAHVCTVANVLV